MSKTDAEVKQDVLHELRWDSHLDKAELNVEADSGTIRLLGTVSSWGERMAAEAAAHRVARALHVVNAIDVNIPIGMVRTDTDIAHSVRLALEWNVFVPNERVKSTVANAQVTLDGNVDNGTQREEAERAIVNLASVRAVINRIQIKIPTVTPFEVQQAIEGALERRALREAKRVGLDVHEGRVVLTGIVGSWAERQSVVGAVRGTAGVRSIDDRLRVSSD